MIPEGVKVHLPAGARRRVVSRAIALLGAATVLALLANLGLYRLDRGRAAEALLLGHLIGHAITLSWLLGAIYSFDKRDALSLTLGLSPLRMMTAAAAIVGAVAAFDYLELPLVLSYLATHVYGHVVEAVTLRDLAAATTIDVGTWTPPDPPKQDEDPAEGSEKSDGLTRDSASGLE